MSTARGPILVAASGPDGVGKSSLVRRLAPLLREHGFAVATTYCYGCFLCRRFRGTPRWRYADGEQGRRGLTVFGAWVDRVHALVDAVELTVRVAAARLRVRARARGRPTAVLTDRGPLDGLAKFDPPPASPTARRLTRLAGRYDITLLVERRQSTAPLDPTPLLPLDGWTRYHRWARSLPSVVPLNNATTPSDVTAQLVRLVVGAGRPEPKAADSGGRKRVVISIFDDVHNPDYRGGGAVVAKKIGDRLAEEFDVTVVTAARRGGTRTHGRVRYRYLPVSWAGPRAGQLLFQAMLPFMARRIPHDLWLESFTPPFSTSFLPLVTRAPVVGIDQVRSGDAMWRKYHIPFFLVERLGFRCYRNLVVMNEADALTVRGMNPRATVQVISNGVARQRIDKARLGEGAHVLFLGRVDIWQKGLDLLLAAYAKAAVPMPLILAGNGTQTAERKLRTMLARQGQNVHRLGHVSGEDKRQLLENSAMVVMPSRHETFGLVALEAMSYGKPVLHFDLPPLRWMIGGGSVTVPPFDVDAMAAQIRRLAMDEECRRQLGGQAVVTARRYSWEKMTDRYLALVRGLLDPAVSRPRPVRDEADVP